MNAPTPAEFARQLAVEFGPHPDPTNPFFQPVEIAVRRLLLQAIADVFGAQDPFAKFGVAYERAYRLSVPVHGTVERADCLQASLEDMRAAWEVIEQDTLLAIDQMLDDREG